MRDEYLWVEKWRPKKVADTILPKDLQNTFQEFVDSKNIPNLILAGGPGVGKTTIAKAMLEQLDCDYIVINGSLSGNIDTLRNEIMQFASSVSLSGGRKYVILDEADYLNPNCTGISRIVGVMNLDAPFTISDKTVSFQYSFVLTDFGIEFNDDSGSNSVPDAFGSGPFSGKFTIIDSE